MSGICTSKWEMSVYLYLRYSTVYLYLRYRISNHSLSLYLSFIALHIQHLKSRYGTGYQIELKVNLASTGDDDVEETIATLIDWSSENNDKSDSENGNPHLHTVVFNLSKSTAVVQHLTSNNYLSSKINGNDPAGHLIFKNSKSDVGVDAYELAAFCTSELRLRAVTIFFEKNYPESVLRERQDSKLRFEVSPEE